MFQLKFTFQIIRRELISVVEFQYFEKDRLILRENHRSHAMYFVITGEILITQSSFDTEAAAILHNPVNILSAGDSFGQLGLIYNIPRNASASTKSRLTMNSLSRLTSKFLSVRGLK